MVETEPAISIIPGERKIGHDGGLVPENAKFF
jgi:hypothetical protein